MIAFLLNGPRLWASSRFRGYWYADAAPLQCRAYGPGDPLVGIDDCETVVFQKRYREADIERAKRYRAEGRRVIFDLVDPMWWWWPSEVNEMLRTADLVTTSSEGMAAALRAHGGVQRVEVIPDRMLASYHPAPAEHGPRERVVVGWFGATQNRIALMPYVAMLGYVAHHRAIELRIIDGEPNTRMVQEDAPHLAISHAPWAVETFHAQLTACDLAILPPYPGPWGALKSNNKQVTAWWAGLPVVDGMDLDPLARFIDSHDKRAAVGAANRAVAERDWEIGRSIEQWLALSGEASGVKPAGSQPDVESVSPWKAAR